jgi:hypothetical protein
VTSGRHVTLVGVSGLDVDDGMEQVGLTMLAAEVLSSTKGALSAPKVSVLPFEIMETECHVCRRRMGKVFEAGSRWSVLLEVLEEGPPDLHD